VIRRALGWAGLALLAALAAAAAWNWTHVRAFPGILPAFYAKEWCSCRYVMGQDDAYCHGYARQWLPIWSFAHDPAAQRVTVTALGATRSASFLGGRRGCRLEP
jgi:hypothetical protein